MNNQKFTVKLEWINQDEFQEFLKDLKETHKNDDAFESEFCFKFNHGQWKCKLLFNQENGFYFD